VLLALLLGVLAAAPPAPAPTPTPTAPAPAAAAAPKTRLKLWHSYNRNEREALERALGLYQESHPAIEVETSFVPFDALTDKLSAAIPRGHGPDVFIFAHDRIGGWAEGGLLEPIELFVDEALLDRHASTCVFALAYGESLYGLPLAFKAQALYVRTDRIKQPPADYDELIALAKQHTRKAEGRYGLVYPNADLFFHTPLLFSLGGRIYPPEDPLHPNVSNAGVEASFELARRLYKEEGLLPDDPSSVVASSMFSEGRTPMVMSGPWFRSEIDPGVPYTVVPIPAFPAGVASSGFSTCEGVLLSRRSAHKPEAFELMRWLSSDPRSADLRMSAGGQTVTLLESWEHVLPGLPPAERAILGAFKAAFERSVPTPSHPSMNAVWTPLNAALYKVIHKDMAPAAAAEEAQGRIAHALGAGAGAGAGGASER
jgi:arabinogalactan oligomer/maltooligosaccharide transport system permease protein